MRREGRMHGSNVRVGKRQRGHICGGEKLSSKPTNQSKCTFKHPVGVHPVPESIILTETVCPLPKATGKSKSAFKAKGLDITRNHLLQDWSIYERDQLAVEECDCLDAYCEHSHGEEEEDADLRYIEETVEEQVDEGEYWLAGSSRDRARTEMVLPIETFMSMRRRKRAPRTVPGQDHDEVITTVGDDCKNAESDIVDSDNAFESWWGLGFYDEEEVPDDWFLITEGEGFVA